MRTLKLKQIWLSTIPVASLALAGLTLAGCDRETEPVVEEDPVVADTDDTLIDDEPEVQPTNSILRPAGTT